MLNISQCTLSNWERSVHNIDNKSLIRLSGIFGVSIGFILGATEEEKEPVSEVGEGQHLVRILGYGGVQIEKELTKEQMDDVIQYIEFLKSKGDH